MIHYKGIGGGLASVLGHFDAKCKNKQIDPEYSGRENYLKYFDIKSLYFSAMVKILPTGEISACDDKSYTISSSSSSTSSNNIGYKYTKDFKQDAEQEQKTQKYSFFPETIKANIDQFTDYQNENKKRKCKPNEKLMLKFTDEKDYVIDDEMLDWYLDH